MSGGGARAVLEKGAALCAAQLKKISGAEWRPVRIETDETAAGSLERMLGAASGDQYGSWFTVPGGAFLIVIPRACGMRLTDRFTRDHAEAIDMLEQRESAALAEISNILVNSFVTALADALGEDLVVSAPTRMLDSSRELLVKSLRGPAGPGRYAAACLAAIGSTALSSELTVVFLLEPAADARLRA